MHPRTEADYEKSVWVMNKLLDAGASDEGSPLTGLVDMLGSLIGEFEDTHHSAKVVSPAATLRFVRAQHSQIQTACMN